MKLLFSTANINLLKSCKSEEVKLLYHSFQVIANHDDLELAMFMSKTLVSSIISFTKRSKAASEERARNVSVGIDERYRGREEYTNVPISGQVIELDRDHDSSPKNAALSRSQLRRQKKKELYVSHAYDQPVAVGFDRDERNSSSHAPQATRFNEFSPAIASLMRNSPPRRGQRDNRRDSGDDYYSTLSRDARLEAASKSRRDSYDRSGDSGLTRGLRADPESFERSAEVESRYPEMALTRETIPRRASITERVSSEEVDLRSKLMSKNYQPVVSADSIDSRSYTGIKRVGSEEYSHESAKQARFESQYPY